MSKILLFVSAALADKENSPADFQLGVIPPFRGQQISQDTGVKSIAGAKKTLTAHGVRHAFVRHNNIKSEDERGQVAIVEKDFIFLADILSSPDKIVVGDNQNRKKQDILIFSKAIKGRMYNVLMSINRSKNGVELVFNTMFIKK